MKRALAFTYGVISYGVFLASFLYLIGFLGNFAVPETVDRGGAGVGPLLAVIIDVGLIALFGLQHSVMARPGFKRVWTRIVPSTIERSTYVLITSLLLFFFYWAWQPIGHVIWQADTAVGAALGWGVLGAGFALVLVSTFLIDHFELFGLKQVTMNLLHRVPVPPAFQVRWLYRYVRHPIYLGWTLAFWGTPVMTSGHLLFALGMTGYMLVAIRYEERDLITFHGRDYARYREQVPMLVPRPGRAHPGMAPVRTASAGAAMTRDR